ncbi:unnamed protein product [Ilex paraguariensis]|uniref:WAT1-related protein n=1 Tax=Ilex paraguariensis TaxID=185542 RepID=A0ABC8RF92_9AQUA
MGTMGRICNTINDLKPAMMMVTAQIAIAGVNIFCKLAANDGMSLRVLVAYRFMFATATVLPLALCIERKKRPKLTWTVIGQGFTCALFGGSLAQNFYAQSLVLTSATFAAAITNLIPAITFIMAILFGLERLGWGTMAGKAKIVGTLMGIAGAMLLTFYKGIEINLWPTHVDLLHEGQHQVGHVAASHHKSINHILGPLLALACCFSTAFSLMIQAKMSQRYPCHYSSTALICMMGSLQAVIFAFCMERDWRQWKLGWNIRLLTVVYSGTIASGLMVTFIMFCVRMKGPLFVSVFSPLMLVVVAIASSLLLNEKLHFGSVAGGGIIVCALYLVLWGKSKEMKRIAQLMPSKSSRESDQVDNVVTSSVETRKRISISNIIGVAPNFLTMTDTDGSDNEEEEENAEKNPNPNVKV